MRPLVGLLHSYMHIPNNQKHRMKPTVFSFGYSGQDVQQFIADVHARGVVVIDTRIKPYSRRPEWNKTRLQAALGDAYVHVGELGNLNYQHDGPVQLVDLAAGVEKIEAILQRSQSVVLICICPDERDCHRRGAVTALVAHGWTVENWTAQLRSTAE